MAGAPMEFDRIIPEETQGPMPVQAPSKVSQWTYLVSLSFLALSPGHISKAPNLFRTHWGP